MSGRRSISSAISNEGAAEAPRVGDPTPAPEVGAVGHLAEFARAVADQMSVALGQAEWLAIAERQLSV